MSFLGFPSSLLGRCQFIKGSVGPSKDLGFVFCWAFGWFWKGYVEPMLQR